MMRKERVVKVGIFFLLLGIVSGCSQDSFSGDLVPVELRVRETAVPAAASRALPEEAFSATVALTTTESDYTALTGTYDGIHNVDVDTQGGVTWKSPAYYPPDGSWLWLVGFSPVAVPSGGQVVYTLSGKEDLIYASQLKGNRWNGERFSGNTDVLLDRPLAFKHLLTRLQFCACKAGEEGVSVKIKKITVKEASGTATLSLATGQVVFGSSSGLSLTLPDDGTEVTGSTAVDLGYLTLPPVSSGTPDYTLEVETSSGTFSDVPIEFTGGTVTELLQAGHSHKITLTLSDHSLGITSVQVSPWPTVEVDEDIELIQ